MKYFQYAYHGIHQIHMNYSEEKKTFRVAMVWDDQIKLKQIQEQQYHTDAGFLNWH